jgi:hypothetical protein
MTIRKILGEPNLVLAETDPPGSTSSLQLVVDENNHVLALPPEEVEQIIQDRPVPPT